MKNTKDNSIAIASSPIEQILVWSKNRNNLDSLKNQMSLNGKVVMSDYIDCQEFETIFKFKPLEESCQRAMEKVLRFIHTASDYFRIDILTLNELELIDFLKNYIQEFPSAVSFSKFNMIGWKGRSVRDQESTLKTLKIRLSKL